MRRAPAVTTRRWPVATITPREFIGRRPLREPRASDRSPKWFFRLFVEINAAGLPCFANDRTFIESRYTTLMTKNRPGDSFCETARENTLMDDYKERRPGRKVNTQRNITYALLEIIERIKLKQTKRTGEPTDEATQRKQRGSMENNISVDENSLLPQVPFILSSRRLYFSSRELKIQTRADSFLTKNILNDCNSM